MNMQSEKAKNKTLEADKAIVVSVCCVTYNQEEYVAQALDSFLAQKTNFSFEIVVRDDGSTDLTGDIIRDYAKKYPSMIRAIIENENTYSKGIKPMPSITRHARGEYIAYCDGDDYWISPEKLQMQVDALRQEKACDLCFHSAQILRNEKLLELTGKTGGESGVVPAKVIIKSSSEYCPTSSMMVRRCVAEEISDFLEGAGMVSGDYYYQVIASLRGGAMYLNQVMSVYRVGDIRSLSNRKNFKQRVTQASSSWVGLSKLDKYSKYMYSQEISEIKEKINIRLAFMALREGKQHIFSMIIGSLYCNSKIKTLRVRLLYYVRMFHPLIKCILTIRDRVRRRKCYRKGAK